VKDERPDLEGFVADVGGSHSEWPQAERVGRHLGVHLHRIEIDRPTYLRDWVDAIWHRDLPLRHPSDPAMLAVTRACRERGFKVLLTGEGADEVFGGYGWYRRGHRRWRKLRRRSRVPWLFPASAREWRRCLRMPHLMVEARDDPDFRFRLATGIAPAHEFDRFRIQERLASIEPPEHRTFLAMQLDDLRWHLAWILFRHDRIGMAASIESRVPFLANGIPEYGLNLPVPVKYHRDRTKWVLKEVAAERLPKDVVHARKQGFPVPLALYAGTAGLLRGGLVPDLLRWTDDETARIVAALDAGRQWLLPLVSLEIWARLFLGGASPAALAERLLAVAGENVR
jgi:asparagine synthase (glutamine-hydrolysing)